MKLTLLEYVVDILNDMDSDLVNSINDTFESEQVAQIVKSTYFAMMSNRNWPHMRKALRLEASGTTDRPTHLTVQDSIKEMILFNYNCTKPGDTRKYYKEIKYLDPDDFLRHINHRDNSKPEVDVIRELSGVDLLIYNNKSPTYYTSFNEKDLVLDSYDKNVESTIQNTNVQAQAYVMPNWEPLDDFVPDLPEEAVTALLEEAKSRAMFKLKQMQDLKAEQEASRQQRWLSRKAWTVKGGIKYPNYGRNGRKGGRDVTFNRDR